jgi:small-conductance mechanosensitive channel
MDDFKEIVQGSGMNPWIYTSCVFVIVLTTLFMVRRFVWARLLKWTEATEKTWDDELLKSIALPITVLFVILAFGIAGQSAPAVVRTHPLLIQGVKVAMIMSVIWLIERALSVIFRSQALPEGVNGSTRTLFLTITRAVLFSLGFLIVLDTVGVSITPVLASLGVGSVAVALALQDTLSNFFGGLYILIDKPIRVGDFIKIDEVEGQVDRIGWRGTWIRTLANDIIVFPNSKVAGAQLKNYDLPNSTSALLIPCSVAYGADLGRVESVTIEVAREVLQRVPGGDRNFEPAVRYTAFADSSINLNVVLQILRFSDTGMIRHEFIKALHLRYLQEQIEIPYPQRVVYLAQQ